jgi:predicted DNA-binding transcriptional regulator YafY
MSKRGYISRYLLILKKLKSKPYTGFEELIEYLEHEFQFLLKNDAELFVGVSKRTLQRDIREISNMFGIDIEYSRQHKGYFIAQNDYENMNFQRMMEAFDLFNSLNIAHDLSPHIYLENRQPQGTENIYGLLHAIKNRFKIEFDYQKFWEEDLSRRSVEPVALKEFKHRWYLMAIDDKDFTLKSFALDRLSNLGITAKKFSFPAYYDITDNYRYCFGIMSPNHEGPEEVVLSFEPLQGKYVKTLPLHETQHILEDNDDELLIGLKLYITYDFIMELLSFGENLKVVKPDTLAEHIKTAHQRAFEQYRVSG